MPAAGAGDLIRDGNDFDHGNDATAGARVDDLDKALFVKLVVQIDRNRFSQSDVRTGTRSPRPRRLPLRNSHIGKNSAILIFIGLFDYQPLINTGDQSRLDNLCLEVIASIGAQRMMYVPPRLFEIWVHPRERTLLHGNNSDGVIVAGIVRFATHFKIGDFRFTNVRRADP